MALGTWAMACVGVFISALTVNLRLREVMLPMRWVNVWIRDRFCRAVSVWP